MSAGAPAEVMATLLGRFQWACSSEPWSLAELRVDDQEFLTLQACFGRLEPNALRAAFNGLAAPVRLSNQVVGGQAIHGLFLLLLFAETARRNASEGTLWIRARSTRSWSWVLRSVSARCAWPKSIPLNSRNSAGSSRGTAQFHGPRGCQRSSRVTHCPNAGVVANDTRRIRAVPIIMGWLPV